MQHESNIDIENIIRMNEIADIYSITNQVRKEVKYHSTIIEICNKYPQNEKILEFKIQSSNRLNGLLKISPLNMDPKIGRD